MENKIVEKEIKSNKMKNESGHFCIGKVIKININTELPPGKETDINKERKKDNQIVEVQIDKTTNESTEKLSINTMQCSWCHKECELHWRNVCTDCHKSWYEIKLARFMVEKIGSCLVCINCLCNNVQPMKHWCTRNTVVICDTCDKEFGEKSSLIKHLERNFRKNRCQKFRDNMSSNGRCMEQHKRLKQARK